MCSKFFILSFEIYFCIFLICSLIWLSPPPLLFPLGSTSTLNFHSSFICWLLARNNHFLLTMFSKIFTVTKMFAFELSSLRVIELDRFSGHFMDPPLMLSLFPWLSEMFDFEPFSESKVHNSSSTGVSFSFPISLSSILVYFRLKSGFFGF